MNLVRSSLAIAIVALACLSGLAGVTRPKGAAGKAPATARQSTRTEMIGRSAACGVVRTGRLDYSWPVRPFDRQHPIRGNFGDPRTISLEEFGVAGRNEPGLYSFHNGVDISAKPGTAVYPVVSGGVSLRRKDEVIVQAGSRHFQYWHIIPTVRLGEHVFAGVTILGRVQWPAGHVHLSEIDAGRVTNPARHLRPYIDRTPPLVGSLNVRSAAGQSLPTGLLTGRVAITVEASDRPPIRAPGAWAGVPVAPAVLQWTFGALDGRRVTGRTVADFRHSEPSKKHFWNIYAAGTYQNFPVFDQHLFWRQPGRYLFQLTRTPLDTRKLPNGRYSLHVTATDLCGNQGTLSQPELISNPAASTVAIRESSGARRHHPPATSNGAASLK